MVRKRGISMMKIISTNFYNIYLGHLLFPTTLLPTYPTSQILSKLVAEISASSWLIVSDSNVAEIYRNIVTPCFPEAYWVIIQPGEKYKTLDTIRLLYSQFNQAKLDRNSVVVALGGGVVGDIAGFAAATYMRGLGFIQMPTSLLAMADASIGSKVGVDLPEGKNLVGCFKQPLAIWMAYETLQTLPDIEWQCGMAEIIKHGLLGNTDLLKIQNRDDLTIDLLEQAIKVKLHFVEQDPEEKNVRAYLNLGHTFAHAIEKAFKYNFRHGEAVSLGLIAAGRLSEKLGICSTTLPLEIEQILIRLGLPTSISEINPEACYNAMSSDKKCRIGKPQFVLLRAIGQPTIIRDAPKEKVIEILESLIL